jgi:DNA-binding transcriptional LysR family regulator
MITDRVLLFFSAAKHRSISQAAREHRISQPAVSRQLKLLQQDLDVILYNRKGRGIELTQPGYAFCEVIRAMVSSVDAFKRNHRAPTIESLIIGSSHGPSVSFLPLLVSQFKKRYPSVNPTLRTASSGEVEEWIMISKVDLGLVNDPSMSPWFHTEPYRCEQLVAFVTPGHPLAKKQLEANKLSDIPFVIKTRRNKQSKSEEQLNKLGKNGFKFTIAMRCESPQSVMNAVRHGVGVGLLFYETIKGEIDRGEFSIVKLPGIELIRENYVVYSKEKPLSSVARQFLSLLRASVPKGSPIETMTFPTRIPNRRGNSHTSNYMLRAKLLSWIISIASVDWIASALV